MHQVHHLKETRGVASASAGVVAAGAPPQAVAVPTHFYKVVLAETTDPKTSEKHLALSAFAMPNRPIDPSTPLTSFVVPLEFLEGVTGIQFFPNILDDRRRRAVDAAATGALLRDTKPCCICQKRLDSIYRATSCRKKSGC